jgi:hypothetical protein
LRLLPAVDAINTQCNVQPPETQPQIKSVWHQVKVHKSTLMPNLSWHVSPSSVLQSHLKCHTAPDKPQFNRQGEHKRPTCRPF